MFETIVAPSISTLYYSIYYFLVNHPLLNSGLVKDTFTQLPIEISQYRLMGGFSLNEGLTCSIYPLTDNSFVSSPATINTSAIYNSYNLGMNADEVKYHFVIDYSYRSINVDAANRVTDENLIKVPKEHVVFPKDVGKVSRQTKTVNLYINPALDIVCQYLELTRLALEDSNHMWNFPLGNTQKGTLCKVEPLHINLPTVSNWEKGTNVLDTRGYILIRLNAYLTRDWRKLWQIPIEKININSPL